MKTIYYLFILVLIINSSCNATKYESGSKSGPVSLPVPSADAADPALVYSDQTTWLLGYFQREQMSRTPHNVWYMDGYDIYKPDSSAVNKLLQIPIDDLTIKVVMGTWCPDSRREVPRFLHVIDLWKFPMDRVTFIGVDNSKLSPVGEYEQLDIQRVPTFIFYKKNVETGRIIENPLTSLEQDIVNILTKE